MKKFIAILGMAYGLVWPAVQAQQNAIENVTATQLGTGVMVIKLQLKTPIVSLPPSFSVANPARVALDFSGTANTSGQNSVEVNQGDLRSINIVQVGERSRVVLNLRRSVPYNAVLEGNAVVVTLDSTSNLQSVAMPSVAITPSSSADSPAAAINLKPSIREIDFRRGRDGEGRIVVDLSDARSGVDIRQQGQQIIVDFLGTALSPALRRRLDVADFGTPVQVVSTFAQGENTRMVIEPRGLWEHNAYQSDTQFVVEVKPVREDPNKLVQGSQQGYKGEKLSLNFQNIDVRSVLQVIADFTNLNIITSETVTGNLTLRLRDVPWDQALDIVLQAKGLDMRKNGNVIWIAPRDELATKEKLDLESRQTVSDLEPLRTESIQLNYQKAADVLKIISDDKQRLLSKRGGAVPDSRTNQIFVSDIPSKIDDIRRLVKQIDVAQRQVLIEARIVEADDGFSRNLGVRLFGHTGQPRSVLGSGVYGSLTGGSVALGAPGTTAGATGTDGRITSAGPDISIGGNSFVNLPASGLNGFNAGGFAVTLFNSSLSRVIGLEISALESDGRGRLISSPRVVTADQVRATIEDGEEIPYEQASSSGATSISFRKAVLKLDVTPQITPEGNVILTVNVNKDSRGVDTRAGPAINTKNINTQVLIENGGTVVIGGIYSQTERNDTTKIPLLGDLPYVGALFRTNARVDNRKELLVFLTPRVINSGLIAAQQR